MPKAVFPSELQEGKRHRDGPTKRQQDHRDGPTKRPQDQLKRRFVQAGTRRQSRQHQASVPAAPAVSPDSTSRES